MYHWMNDGWTWWWMVPMMIFMLAVVGVIVWALANATRGAATPQPPPARSPEDVLAERFARGEIDSAEYHERLTALRDHVAR